MGLVSRFFLLMYVLVVATAIIIAAGVCLHLIPTFVWQEELKYIIAQRETLIVLAVLLFFSLYFVGIAFSSNKNAVIRTDEIILKQGEPGEVKVAIEAIKSLTERAAHSVMGVREADVVINTPEGEVPISVQMTIVLGQGYSAPAVSETVTKIVSKAIFTALQITNVPIEISVKDITNAVTERKQRVK